MNDSVPGLRAAMASLSSDKIKDRADGLDRVGEIFSNPETVLTFHESASKRSGAGWFAFFQCLFQVVVIEKKAVTKKGTGTHADARLKKAVALVRRMVEKSVHHIRGQTVLALFQHMTQLLVYRHKLFEPTEIDYPKAIRCLLSYPPHLDNLDVVTWKTLMGVCWAVVLGDPVVIDADWEGNAFEDENEGMDVDIDEPEPAGASPRVKPTSLASSNELAGLIPILLSNPIAPLVPDLKARTDSTGLSDSGPSRIGYIILLKIHRFFSWQLAPMKPSTIAKSVSSTPTPKPLSAACPAIFRSLNMVLTELELNSRKDFVNAGIKLLPQLVAFWEERKEKWLREPVLTALRTLLPFLAFKDVIRVDTKGLVFDSATRLVEGFAKRVSTNTAVFELLDFASIRFHKSGTRRGAYARLHPFETTVLSPGFHFESEKAIAWVSMELYADLHVFLYDHLDVPRPTPAPTAKRRKIENGLESLITATTFGSLSSRLLCLQVLIFVIFRHWASLHSEAHSDIRQKMVSLLDEVDPALQSWAFVGLSALSLQISREPNDQSSLTVWLTPTHRAAKRQTEDDDWEKVWSHCVRKISVGPLCRAACHMANTLVRSAMVPKARVTQDIHNMLQNVDIQGPTHPYDSVCAFLTTSLEIARNDTRLYTLELEEKVLSWWSKWTGLGVGNINGRKQLDPHTPADLLCLLNQICRFRQNPLSEDEPENLLPDCLIVDRILEEARTAPIRDFVLFSKLPVTPVLPSKSTSSPKADQSQITSQIYLEGRPRRTSSTLLKGLENLINEAENPRPAFEPADVRWIIDFVVVALAFQASLELNGVRSDPSCLQAAVRLVKIIQAPLMKDGVSLPNRTLMWSGLSPLVHIRQSDPDSWPMLLRPDVQSGIRKDLLPPDRYARAELREGDNESTDLLQSAIWRLPSISEALAGIIDGCRLLLEMEPGLILTEVPFGHGTDVDDGFAENRTAASDIMPHSRDLWERQGGASAHMGLLVRLRLRGAMLASPASQSLQDPRPTRDVHLINSLLDSEGERFILIGNAVCQAVNSDILQLTPGTVDAVLECLEVMIRSYAYARHEGLWSLAMSFIGHSVHVWTSKGQEELGQRAIGAAILLVERVSKGLITSWKLRLSLLCFLSEYFEYDPDFKLWKEVHADEDDQWGPVAVITAAVVDRDSRVRYRAASCAAGLVYLPSFTPKRNRELYLITLNSLTGDSTQTDAFLCEILWKLNSAISSHEIRSMVIYHLYEVREATKDYDPYLQTGLEAVASRLGLDSLSTLYLTYANLIVQTQLRYGQSVAGLPHKLYGFTTRRAFAQACLETVGPTILARGGYDTLYSLCEAAGIAVSSAVTYHLPAAIALLCLGVGSQSGFDVIAAPVDFIKDIITAAIVSDISPDSEVVLRQCAERVQSHIFCVQYAMSSAQIAECVRPISSSQADLFGELTANDVVAVDQPPMPVHPGVSAATVLSAHIALEKKYRGETSKTVFDGLLNLFYAINRTHLVTEQQGYLRSIALLTAVYQEDFNNAPILAMFLRSLLLLVDKPDICLVVFSHVKWAFAKIPFTTRPIDNLVDIILLLGSSWSKISTTSSESRKLTQTVENWIAESVPIWAQNEHLKLALELAVPMWPAKLSRHFETSVVPMFSDLARFCERHDIETGMILCQRLAAAINIGDPAAHLLLFSENTFWHLKGVIKPEKWSEEGGMAFLDILHRTHGRIHPPNLSAIKTLTPAARYDSLKLRLRKDQQTFLRAVLVEKIFAFTTNNDHCLRKTAYSVLQSLLPALSDMIKRSVLGETLLSEISHLVPSSSLKADTIIDPKLATLCEGQTWLRKSQHAAEWSSALGTLLCESIADPFYTRLDPLLSAIGPSSIDFVPYIVQAVLIHGLAELSESSSLVSSEGKGKPSQGTATERSRVLSRHLSMVLQWPSASIETVKTIIDIVLHLRNFQPPYQSTALAYNSWLEIDPLLLSEAAIKSGAFATALLFLEVAKDAADNLDLSTPRIQNIMYEVYSNVEDPDGFYGIHNRDVKSALLRKVNHEGEYWRAFGYNGASVETQSTSTIATAVLRNLHDFGFSRLARAVMSSGQSDQINLSPADPLYFELAWRTGDWDLPVSHETEQCQPGLFYAALQAIHRERDLAQSRAAVSRAIKMGMAELSNLGLERMAQIKQTAADLLCLRDMALWLSPATQDAIARNAFDSTVVTGFVHVDSGVEFRHAENLTATRLSLLHAAQERERRNLIGDLGSVQLEGLSALEKACQLRLSELARREGKLQAAVNAITAVQNLESGIPSDLAQDEFSHVLWSQKEHSLAIQHVDEIVQDIKRRPRLADEKNGRLAVLLARKAHWTALAKMKAAHEIKDVFDEATALARQQQLIPDDQAQIYHEYAGFADQHYVALCQSPELERLRVYRDRKKTELQQLQSTQKQSGRRESSVMMTEAKAEYEEDARAVKDLEAERFTYLRLALRMYADALAVSTNHDDSITRLCSLWLEHSDNDDINKAFSGSLQLIPSYKFIFLGPQLAARLYKAKKSTPFNTSLNSLLLRISRQHPFHILYTIITLAHGTPLQPKGRSNVDFAEGRGPAAADILLSLNANTENGVARTAAKEMKLYADAAVLWCNDTEKKPASGKEAALPVCPLTQLTKLHIPVSTCPPSIDISGRYKGVPTFVRFRSKYKVAGGVHRPTILDCLDSNAKEYTQLFKGDDDVRQDAVMEQVFGLSNDLLKRDRKTNARDLHFRTYVVVPLAEKTGIIEFVKDTLPIGDWLKRAHSTYRKGIDITPDIFRQNMKAQQDKDKDSPELVKIFAEMRKEFQPVLRHFFTEKHKDPMAWFAMKLNYSRSVAVTSMVGYMVGLGDRHCSNILIDQVSGELVHIDFGIVFDEGLKLRVPEKVPFRLTNDIVDGLGITGVDGTFRRCSEHTLRVLREASELIMTVLEVFKHDPLYAWTGDPDKLERAQGGGKVEALHQAPTVQEKADRVLSRIRHKLDGHLSIEYTVNQLIQEARDVENLARIYHGWQGWL